jgi:phytoene dehydrogenase-like protein
MPRAVIVGAGLAGLVCAADLAGSGWAVEVVEADDAPGGRVRTDAVEGFACDRGFQVLLGAYPRAAAWFPPAGSGLHAFAAGALVRWRGGFKRLADPRRRPLAGLASLVGGPLGLGDALAMRRWLARCRRAWDGADRPLDLHLRDLGFGRDAIQGFLRPFLAGITLDPHLTGSARFADFLIGCFADAPAYLPAGGIGALPTRLAARLPAGALRLGVRAQRIAPGRVELAGGGVSSADAVVLAVDPDGARALGFDAPRRPWRATTAFYFAAERDPVGEPILVLGPADDGPINSVCVPSTVAPGIAPPGAHLVSASILGLPEAGTAGYVREQLRRWYGAQVDSWRLIRTAAVERALPEFPPGTPPASPPRLAPGIYRAGDAWGMPAIEGAVRAGEAAAAAIRADLES